MYWLPRMIGPARAFEIMSTGRPVKADEALQLGMVANVVPAEELEAARNEAIKAMETKARELGANGIIGLKISYNNLGGTMGNTILVTVYGTAVTYK